MREYRFERKIGDLHMHLNGSFSMDCLEKIAKKNNCMDDFLKLKQTREQYAILIQQEAIKGSYEQSIKLIWTPFSLEFGHFYR